MGIAYFSTVAFHEASTQLLNKDVAAHIAEFTSPFENNGINKKKADSVFHDAMVISPGAEVYFLNPVGKVIAFHASEKDIRLWNVPLQHIQKLIESKGEKYIKGADPKDPSNPKIFSAAEVNGKTKKLGYIYVILSSNQQVTKTLYNSYLGSLLLKALFVVIAVSVIFSFIYINRIKRGFNQMIPVFDRFEKGDLTARFETKEAHDEMAPITHSFNKLADLLVYNINRLTNSEKERKDFIANISHDLRTPLSIARGYTETLLMKNGQQVTPDKQEEFLQLVHRKIRQVEHMVKQLFDLSKMEFAESMNKEPFVLSEIVQETVNNYQLIAGEKKVILKCTQCQYHVWVNADIAMMERVFQNLIDNAIKNTPQDGDIQVSIVANDKELIFAIENSGSSIPADIVSWINQSEDESSFSGSRPAKLGLGLLIVKKILHLHQYYFKAEVNVGVGNRFTIIMPIIQHTPYNSAS
jgi:signal transduction histidine kinase